MLNDDEKLKVIGNEWRQILAVMHHASKSGRHHFVLWDGRTRTLWSYSDERQSLLSYTLQEKGVMTELLGDKPLCLGHSQRCLFNDHSADGRFGLREIIRSYEESEPIKGFQIEGMGWKRLCTEIRHETRAKVPVAALNPVKAIPFSEVWFYPDHVRLVSDVSTFCIRHRSVRYRGDARAKVGHIFA